MADVAVYRRVTRQCAKDDWPQCQCHDDVARRYAGRDLYEQFQKQDPQTWYTGDAPRDRRRDLRPRQKAPGKRVIGSLKTQGYRGWVWHDDGSMYDVAADFSGFDLHWMIAHGNRRRGDRSDLQTKRLSLLHDPDDTWRPQDSDYEELLAEHDDGFTERAIAAVQAAVDRAERQHNTVIPIRPGEVEGSVVHEHDEDEIDGVVVEEINERWLLLSKQRTGGRPLTFTDALAIATGAYPKGVYPAVVRERHSIRGGLLTADPEHFHVFYAELINAEQHS